MQPAFETERLQVFAVLCQRHKDDCFDKMVYLAFWQHLDKPAVICTATINHGTLIGDFVEWVEVKEGERRQGVATEVLKGIEKHAGKELLLTGVSEAGEAFVAKWYSESEDGNERN